MDLAPWRGRTPRYRGVSGLHCQCSPPCFILSRSQTWGMMGNTTCRGISSKPKQSESIKSKFGDRTHPVFRHSKIMNHGDDRRHQPNYLGKFALRGNIIITNVRCTVAPSLVSKTDHFACFRVEFRMRCECQARQLAIKIIETLCLQCDRVHRVWRSILFQCKQLAVEMDDVCVGGGPDFELDRVCIFISVLACQRGGAWSISL